MKKKKLMRKKRISPWRESRIEKCRSQTAMQRPSYQAENIGGVGLAPHIVERGSHVLELLREYEFVFKELLRKASAGL